MARIVEIGIFMIFLAASITLVASWNLFGDGTIVDTNKSAVIDHYTVETVKGTTTVDRNDPLGAITASFDLMVKSIGRMLGFIGDVFQIIDQLSTDLNIPGGIYAWIGVGVGLMTSLFIVQYFWKSTEGIR